MSRNRSAARTIDDNGIGVISLRGWMYSADEWGNPIRPGGSMRVKKSASPPWGSSTPYTPGANERPVASEEMARLSREERTAWELQQGCYDAEMVRLAAIPVGELVAMERRGYTVIEGTKRTIELRGLQVVVWDVEGKEYTTQGLARTEIAERMRATLRQVKRWLLEAGRKLRGEKA